MRSTIRTIAKEAGVSHVTVSHVLRGLDSRTSEETRTRVLETAQRLNYIPVKPPTTQNHHVETRIVTFVPEHHDDRYYELDLFTFQGVVEGARKHGYDVLTMVRHGIEKKGVAHEAHFLDRRSDGFIFNVILHNQWPSVLEAISTNGVPSVVCYHRDVPAGVAWVDIDHARAMHESVAHLVERGHRRIAFVTGPPDNFHAQQRQQRWEEAMHAQGLEIPTRFIVQGTHSVCGCIPETDAVETVANIGATAAVCFSDLMALAVWDATQAQGKSVPGDLSLIGVDNSAQAAARGLTSVTHSFIDVGRLAMEAWIELHQGAEAALCCKTSSTSLIHRESVRTLH